MLFTQCYKDREGCQDVAAVNYDPRADVNCCCEYPQVSLSFSYVYDTLKFSRNQLVHDVNNVPYMLEGFSLGLHGFALLNDQGELKEFRDSFHYEGNKKVISKNSIFSNTSSSLQLGHIDVDRPFDLLSFSLGLQERLDTFKLDRIKGNRKMVDDFQELYHEKKYYDGYIKYIPDTARFDSVKTLYFAVDKKNVELWGVFEPSFGKHMSIPLQVDVSQVLKDFDCRADTTIQRNQLVEAWNDVIELNEN